MVIDTSALLALLLNENDADQFAQAIANDPQRLISVPNVLETTIVVEARHGEAAGRELDLMLHRISASIVAVNEAQLAIARTAWRQFGKGRHPAGLNFGDCFSYALSRHSGEPLLFKGADFSQTDIVPVLPPAGR